MVGFETVEVKSSEDLNLVYPVLRELRKELSFNDFITITEKAKVADGYTIVALKKEGNVLAVMGYRILYDFVHGKHLYIDDLVSSEKYRSQGLGAKLLDYAESVAKKLDCHGLRLCTGIENESGKRFYERHNWKLRAVAYKKKLI